MLEGLQEAMPVHFGLGHECLMQSGGRGAVAQRAFEWKKILLYRDKGATQLLTLGLEDSPFVLFQYSKRIPVTAENLNFFH